MLVVVDYSVDAIGQMSIDAELVAGSNQGCDHILDFMLAEFALYLLEWIQ